MYSMFIPIGWKVYLTGASISVLSPPSPHKADRNMVFRGRWRGSSDRTHSSSDLTFFSTYCVVLLNSNLPLLEKLTWSQPDVSGEIPCPRAAFAYTQIGHHGYLLGGRFRDDRRNDLYRYARLQS